MIDLQTVRQGNIKIAVENVAGQVEGGIAGNRQGAKQGLVVTDGLRCRGDHERRHQVIEQAVVVVGGEDDDQFGVESFDFGTRLGDGRVDFGDDFRAGIVKAA